VALAAATAGAASLSLALVVALLAGGLAARSLVAGATRDPLVVVDRYVAGLDRYVGRIGDDGLSQANGESCTAQHGWNRALRVETDEVARDVGGARSVSLGWVSQGPGRDDGDDLVVTGVVTLTLDGLPDRDGRRQQGWYTRRTWTFTLERSMTGWTVCYVSRNSAF
jgi:hypothetical protein